MKTAMSTHSLARASGLYFDDTQALSRRLNQTLVLRTRKFESIPRPTTLALARLLHVAIEISNQRNYDHRHLDERIQSTAQIANRNVQKAGSLNWQISS